MDPESRNCQNCKNPFVIAAEDFDFYKKLTVPPPTWCPECRMQRRSAYRNERALYKRACDLCQKSIVAMYPANAPFPVYCRECWWSDKWDASTYGAEYDFNKPFFVQFHELMQRVPRFALWQRNSAASEYSNMVTDSKNVYLSASVTAASENIAYSKAVDASFNIVDSFNVVNCENCYENVEGEKNYSSHYLTLSRNCIDCRFLVDCASCRNCMLSSNLRNKEFCIRNKQYSKEDYFVELAKINFGSRITHEALLREFDELRAMATYKFANILRCSGATGNNLLNSKNVTRCFDLYNAENLKNCYRGMNFKDCMDFDYGMNTELTYEYTTGAKENSQLRFAYSSESTRNGDYADCCYSCKDIFGCIGLRKKEHAILNKVYGPEEFQKLREKIIAQMKTMPYVDAVGRTYDYGEFFPPELNVFAYNESVARDYWPLTKEEALAQGFRWRDPDPKTHAATLAADAIPEDIAAVDASILKEVLACEHAGTCNHLCLEVFRLTPDELAFYKKNTLSLPKKCANCRHYERLAKTTPLKLWHRACRCQNGTANEAAHGHGAIPCANEFETPYAPERPERVYCEQCYNAEIA